MPIVEICVVHYINIWNCLKNMAVSKYHNIVQGMFNINTEKLYTSGQHNHMLKAPVKNHIKNIHPSYRWIHLIFSSITAIP